MSTILYLLSPAKKLNLKTFDGGFIPTKPLRNKEASQLMKSLVDLKESELEKIMAAKGKLLNEVISMHQTWNNHPSLPAASLYNGDAYSRLKARDWDLSTWTFAQNHLCILSGLYGVLNPMDSIKPYRLMVGAPWSPNEKYKNLYDFWKDKVKDDLKNKHPKVIVNCASLEYSSMIDGWKDCSLIHIDFKVKKGDQLTSVSSFSKQARGEMVRLAMENKIENPELLKGLDVLGFRFNNNFSDEQNWIYVK